MRPTVFLTLALLWISPATAVTITVQRGDTLTRLAVRHGTTVSALIQANPQLERGTLLAGMSLTLPQAGSAQTWTVEPGDTLYNIARRQSTTIGALIAANPGLDARRALKVGQRLILPVRSAPASARSTPAVRTASIRVGALPVQGRLTTPFRTGHEGIDLAAPTGTPIRAARAGVVSESRFDARTGWGWTVVVDHGDGFKTRYSHNSANLVLKGARVDAGRVIARVGSTGNSTGPHLDFRLTFQGTAINPLSLD
ncbi:MULTISPECIES: LysM peptidoglycan-binding domain-containing M23 family metallopeptidase [Deinococcus]|uniref:LysM peptidoglycan-binding domain-containing M23 family metallopeptidase n=1 Tax=Deinococcus rufus TaxID=2136097 RepID=A0ABV7ZA15_9DEIO|nr:LysM peptidoglycan-binding domain-containing M23 family metallopeptidase [Deinococcus sp. AB2017081]WQE97261.1 LysM peptidoglycan-binding domain-containing M23 family metallopeptidase [Deinococcus sp. AB2017081]